MNKDFVKNMLLAQSYQMKAMKAILPDKVITHLDQISSDLKEVVIETIMESTNQKKNENNKSKEETTVKKVTIS